MSNSSLIAGVSSLVETTANINRRSAQMGDRLDAVSDSEYIQGSSSASDDASSNVSDNGGVAGPCILFTKVN